MPAVEKDHFLIVANDDRIQGAAKPVDFHVDVKDGDFVHVLSHLLADEAAHIFDRFNGFKPGFKVEILSFDIPMNDSQINVLHVSVETDIDG